MKTPYSEYEIDMLVRDTDEISDSPYPLFAAYAISCLYDLAETEGNGIWGSKLPQSIVDKTLENAVADFCAATDNRLPIEIFGKSYRIERVNAFNRKVLINQFDFQRDGEDYIIEKSRIINLMVYNEKPYLKAREELKGNRLFFRKVVVVAEDEANDGWDRLTDMEVAVYCWGYYHFSTKSYNAVEWYSKYAEYIGQPLSEIQKCWNDECRLMCKPNGMFIFSADAVREWNISNGQHSIVDKVPDDKANDYWYGVAVKNRFK